MNIPELKKSMKKTEEVVKILQSLYINSGCNHSDFLEDKKALHTLLSACQLLCDAVEKCPYRHVAHDLHCTLNTNYMKNCKYVFDQKSLYEECKYFTEAEKKKGGESE